jgi:hypothetical protein
MGKPFNMIVASYEAPSGDRRIYRLFKTIGWFQLSYDEGKNLGQITTNGDPGFRTKKTALVFLANKLAEQHERGYVFEETDLKFEYSELADLYQQAKAQRQAKRDEAARLEQLDKERKEARRIRDSEARYVLFAEVPKSKKGSAEIVMVAVDTGQVKGTETVSGHVVGHFIVHRYLNRWRVSHVRTGVATYDSHSLVDGKQFAGFLERHGNFDFDRVEQIDQRTYDYGAILRLLYRNDRWGDVRDFINDPQLPETDKKVGHQPEEQQRHLARQLKIVEERFGKQI